MDKPVLDGWIPTSEAAELTGYSAAYLRGLAGQGRVEAQKVGRDWFFDRESLEAHKREMDQLGVSKHNPWRGDLAEQGRGRRGDPPGS